MPCLCEDSITPMPATLHYPLFTGFFTRAFRLSPALFMFARLFLPARFPLASPPFHQPPFSPLSPFSPPLSTIIFSVIKRDNFKKAPLNLLLKLLS